MAGRILDETHSIIQSIVGIQNKMNANMRDSIANSDEMKRVQEGVLEAKKKMQELDEASLKLTELTEDAHRRHKYFQELKLKHQKAELAGDTQLSALYKNRVKDAEILWKKTHSQLKSQRLITQQLENQRTAREDNLKLAEDELKAEEAKLELIDKQIKSKKEFKKAVMESLGAAVKIAKQYFEYYSKKEQEVAKNGSVYGFSEREYRASMDRVVALGMKAEAFGINIPTFEGALTSTLGRFATVTDSALESMSVLVHSTGLGEKGAAEMVSNMELFNHSIETSGRAMGSLINQAKKSGVATSVAVDKFKNDLKLAQSYTFKNGLKGLQDMSVYSTKLRINMQSVAQLADRISSPEGAIETSAKLQVLGGSFASLSDPLKMLDMGINDMESLTKTYASTLKGLASMNRETGEIMIGGGDRLRIKAAADAIGVSYQEMMDTVRTQAKRQHIESDFRLNPKLVGDEDVKDFITSTAKMKDGKWVVNVQGKDKLVTKLSEADISALKPDEVLMRDLAFNVASIKDHLDRQVNIVHAWGAKGLNGMMQGGRGWIRNRSMGTAEDGGLNMASFVIIAKQLWDVGSPMLKVLGNIDFNTKFIGPLSNMLNKTGVGRSILARGGSLMGGASRLGGKAMRLGGSLWQGAKGVAASSAGRVAGGALGAGYGLYNMYGAYKNNDKAGMWSGGGAALGSIAGSLFGPVGTVVGGLAGQLIGAGLGHLIHGDSSNQYFDEANDIIVPSNGGKPIKLNSKDDIIAAKPNGAIDQFFNSANPTSNVGGSNVKNNTPQDINVKFEPITINGSIKLEGSGGSFENIKLSDLLSNNYFKREITKIITNEIEKISYGGKMRTNVFNN